MADSKNIGSHFPQFPQHKQGPSLPINPPRISTVFTPHLLNFLNTFWNYDLSLAILIFKSHPLSLFEDEVLSFDVSYSLSFCFRAALLTWQTLDFAFLLAVRYISILPTFCHYSQNFLLSWTGHIFIPSPSLSLHMTIHPHIYHNHQLSKM